MAASLWLPTPAPVRSVLALALFLSAPAFAQKADTATKPPLQDLRVERTLNELGFVYEHDETGEYRLLFETTEDRTHLVWVRPDTDYLLNMEVREVYAIANEYIGGVPGAIPMELLEANGQFVLGAWAIDETAIVFVTKIRANASAAELEAALLATASTADELEAELTGDLDEW